MSGFETQRLHASAACSEQKDDDDADADQKFWQRVAAVPPTSVHEIETSRLEWGRDKKSIKVNCGQNYDYRIITQFHRAVK